MDKKELETRLNNLLVIRENHKQDIEELTFVIDGLKKKISAIPNK